MPGCFRTYKHVLISTIILQITTVAITKPLVADFRSSATPTSLNVTTESVLRGHLNLKDPQFINSMKDNAKFRQQAAESFKMLRGTNYIDPKLANPEQKRNRDRNKSRQRGRKRIPGRRKAMQIASRSAVMDSQCTTSPLKQRVRMDGCVKKVIINNYCHGTCRSFFIPRLNADLKPAFKSCSVCVPVEFHPMVVTLQCPNLPSKRVRRTIMKVKRCACKAIQF